MPNAINSIVAVSLTVMSISGCHKSPEGDQNILVDTNVPDNADVEALPADESSTTPTDQLMNGDDNADVADTEGNAGN